MAVNIIGTNNARIDYGDIAALGTGLGALTVSITFNASSFNAGTGRLVCQWGATLAEQAWIITMAAAAEVGFAIFDSAGSVYLGRQTTASSLATGTTYRMVARWQHLPSKAMEIWLNGVNQTVATFVQDNDIVSMNNATSAVQAGRETSSPTTSIDADFSEFALHSAYMPDDYCIAYGKGYSPNFYRKNGILYSLINHGGSRINDIWGGVAGTNTACTSSPHPSIRLPNRRKTFRNAVVVISVFMRPDADDTDGTWTNELGGTTLFSSIDEVTADDADYIQSATTPVNDLCIIRLSNPTSTPAQPFYIRYRYQKVGTDNIDLRVRLLEGTTEIATYTHSNIGSSFTTTEQVLSGAEFASITDFNNLFIEFRANT